MLSFSRYVGAFVQDCHLVLTLTGAIGLMVEFIVLQSPYSDPLSSAWAIFFTGYFVFYYVLRI